MTLTERFIMNEVFEVASTILLFFRTMISEKAEDLEVHQIDHIKVQKIPADH